MMKVRGLYDPAFEHVARAAGFIVRINYLSDPSILQKLRPRLPRRRPIASLHPRGFYP